MGIKNMRAICPNCGGKIHTQGKGLGALTWMASGFLVQTGNHCQHCGVALTGKVTSANRAVLVDAPPPVIAASYKREPVPEDVAARRAVYLAEQAKLKS